MSTATAPLDALFRDRITDIEVKRLGDIQDNPRNPKTHPLKQGRAIKGLVAQIGWAGVPLVYKSARMNGQLTFVDGHLRKREFPDANVRVAITDLTDAEADALLITYDPIAQLAETNKDEFSKLLAEVQPENPAMQDLLETIARKLKIPLESEGEDTSAEQLIERAQELQDKWQVEPGDIWLLDSGQGTPHLLICGDSTLPQTIAALMRGEKARLCMTDPPYNIDYGRSTVTKRKVLANDNLDMNAWIKFVHAFGLRIKENCTGDVYVWGASGLVGEKMRTHLVESLGMHWSSTIIWVKDRFTLGRAKYQHQHEMALHGYVENSTFDPEPPPDLPALDLHLPQPGESYEIAQYGWFRTSSYNDESRNQADVWLVDRPESSPEHATMKPIELMEIGIRNSSRPGDLVIDFFLGSGTTLLACENLGRRCKGAELEPAYCAVTLERFEQATATPPRLIARPNPQAKEAMQEANQRQANTPVMPINSTLRVAETHRNMGSASQG